RRPTMRSFYALSDAKLDGIVRDAPRDVMHRADAPCAARLVRHLADLNVLARSAVANAVAMPALLFTEIGKLENTRQERRRHCLVAFPRSHCMKADDLL